MDYSIQLNAVGKSDKNVKAFASVTFGNCFKVTNIAVVGNKEGVPFVAMPSFKSKERTEDNKPVYKDVCNPITAEFRKALYDDILALYGEMEQSARTEVSKNAVNPKEPEFRVAVTPFEREGSNIRGLVRIYFNDSFVVNNASVIKGKGNEFVSMPSYLANRNGKNGKGQYQDICFPVTKEFRQKLYDVVLECYQQEKEKTMNQEKMQDYSQNYNRGNRQENKELPFR